MRFPIAMIGHFGLGLSVAGLVTARFTELGPGLRPSRVPALLAVLVVGGVAGCGESDVVPNATHLNDPANLTLEASGARSGSEAAVETASKRFVGSIQCVGCHVAEGEKWRGSDHDRAMEIATASSLLGRFDNSTFRRFEQTWRFFQEDQDYFVELDEPGRDIERMRVAYTFGVDPLQQMLVVRAKGRIQALPIAWDARPSEFGGQRWIDLQPGGQTPPGDSLHWEGLAYNWNSQCASCHSTQLVKGYDDESDQFETTWAEIDVGCEACHGAGGEHVAIQLGEVRSGSMSSGFDVKFEKWDHSIWKRAGESRIASRSVSRTADSQLDVCAPCHARRSQISANPVVGAPFMDGYRPTFIEPDLYFEDGQIREEVYVFGSFLQSRMAAAGVRCADCHDPHSLELRREGNALCTGCHDQQSFAAKLHHGHDPASVAGQCVSCHMPERIYMEVDGRRDHSFPIPRPHLSDILNSPNACKNCHAGRSPDWMAEQIASWRRIDPGAPFSSPRWTDHLIEDSKRRNDAQRWLEIALEPLYPEIIRASAWFRFSREALGAPAVAMLQDRLTNGSSFERLGIVEVATRMAPELRVSLLRPLLEDTRLAIRVSAAEALADIPKEYWRANDRMALARAIAERRATLEFNAERPEAQVGLGILSTNYGESAKARTAYERAIARSPYFAPAYANLADLERMEGRNAESVGLLRKAVELVPNDAFVRHALGLALHRSGELDEALNELERAAAIAPEAPRLVLGWALALDAAGRRDESIAVLSAAIDQGLRTSDLQHALVTLLRDSGQYEQAQLRLAAWSQESPQDPRARALVRQLSGDSNR